MSEHSTNAAGIDVSKAWLDLALDGRNERWRLANDGGGHGDLIAALIRLGVTRVGLEASGGYEAAAVAALRAAGMEVIVFQPRQVRAYAVYRLRRAKTDAIDAGLIAACAAAHGPARPAPDPRLAALAESLRLVEQIDHDVARLKTRQEACRDERIRTPQYGRDQAAQGRARPGAEATRRRPARPSRPRQAPRSRDQHPGPRDPDRLDPGDPHA